MVFQGEVACANSKSSSATQIDLCTKVRHRVRFIVLRTIGAPQVVSFCTIDLTFLWDFHCLARAGVFIQVSVYSLAQ
jgi:hypothetical protein